MTLHQIVKRLTGPISSIGETNADEERRQNLETTLELVGLLLDDIDNASNAATSYEFSRARIGKRAHEFLCEIGEELSRRIPTPDQP